MKLVSFCTSLLLFAHARSDDTRVVNLAQGPVRGHRDPNYADIFTFHGIPYASAPTGVHKFKAPQPAPSWAETFDAINSNIICPQSPMMFQMKGPNGDELEMKEDCLVASVYVPDTKDTNLPVVIIVHGGAYQIGYGNMLTPRALTSKGKIIGVTFNYRLSIHGFLCLGTEGAPGNAGMKDMVALLRWVKSNIASFGGNPDDITIDGFSAGASAVEHLVLSDTTKGLFNKAIAESGTAIVPWGVTQDPMQSAKNHAKVLNFTSDDVNALEEFYKTASFDILTLHAFLHETDSTFKFVPCVERDTGVERFLKDSPYDILRTGNYQKLPVLFGFSKDEGMFRLDVFNSWKEGMNSNFANFLPGDLKFKDEAEKNAVAARVKEFYFGGKPVSEDTVDAYVKYFGDVIFGYPTIRSVKLQAEAGSNSIFLYEYAFNDKFTNGQPYSRVPVQYEGANHCAQSFIIYGEQFVGEMSEDFITMRETMQQLWINFIKTGRPVTEASSVLGMSWPPSGPDGSPHMSLNLTSHLEASLHPERTRFWDDIYEKHYLAPIPPTEPKKRVEL